MASLQPDQDKVLTSTEIYASLKSPSRVCCDQGNTIRAALVTIQQPFSPPALEQGRGDTARIRDATLRALPLPLPPAPQRLPPPRPAPPRSEPSRTQSPFGISICFPSSRNYLLTPQYVGSTNIVLVHRYMVAIPEMDVKSIPLIAMCNFLAPSYQIMCLPRRVHLVLQAMHCIFVALNRALMATVQ